MMIGLTYPEGGMLVAGGTGRVGGGTVRKLAEAGVPLVFTYQNGREKADALARELSDRGARVSAIRMDMADSDSVRAAVAAAERFCGGLHGIACAGGPMVAFHAMADMPIDLVGRFLDADAMGILRLFQAAIPLLRERGGGTLVTATTMATRKYISFDGLSPLSKGAVDALVRYVAAEEARHGIRCNAVGIGWVEDRTGEEVAAQTPPLPDTVENEADRMTVLMNQLLHDARAGNPVDPLDAGAIYAFLASDQARCLTGQTLYLDAGILL